MRCPGGFVLGFAVGAVVAGVFGRRVATYVDERTRETRARTAEALDAVALRLEAAARALETARERIEQGLTRPPGPGT